MKQIESNSPSNKTETQEEQADCQSQGNQSGQAVSRYESEGLNTNQQQNQSNRREPATQKEGAALTP